MIKRMMTETEFNLLIASMIRCLPIMFGLMGVLWWKVFKEYLKEE